MSVRSVGAALAVCLTVLCVPGRGIQASGVIASDAAAAKLAALEAQLARPGAGDGRLALWEFGRAMQTAALSPGDEAAIVSRLDELAQRQPAIAAAAERTRFMISALSVGKVAPDITGQDLDGRAFKLSDYRGKVIVLMFSGDWCGICRAQYPYERFLLDLYKDWPFAIVGVASGRDSAAAKTAMTRERLDYRAFWDPGVNGALGGDIAAAWNVVGWPAIYVIDAAGVIRSVDQTQEDLLKSVRLTLTAHPPPVDPRR